MADLKENLKILNPVQVTDCSTLPSTQKLVNVLKTGKEKQIEESYEAYKLDRENYLNDCTLHEEYIVIFEEAASYDDHYNKWKKSLTI